MNRLNRAIVLATVAGLAVAAQTSAGNAIQWPWKKDRANEQMMPPPVEVLPPPPDGTTIIAPAGQAPIVVQEAPLAPNDVMGRLERAEARIRELTGQVEELAFRLRQTQDQLSAVTGQPVPGALPPSQTMAPAPMTTGTTVAAATPSPQVMSDAGPSNQPIDLTSMAGSPPQAAPAAAPTQVASLGDAGADYERAYAAILAGDYVLAEASFRSFIVAFPSDQRMPDARYWLGESLFARGEYRDAADEFLAGYKAYPQSGKAADTLLKLGLSLAGLGEREAACSTYAEVLKKYPNSSNALRQRVQTEQTVSRCA
jgi:tol-pal system protein YbgF